MPLIDPELPDLGSPNLTEDPKILGALTDILGLVNGGLDEENVPGLAGGGGGDGGVPTGSIVMWTGGTAPAGWVFCNGQDLDTTTYSDLFDLIGYTFGGSGANFKAPQLDDRYPKGTAFGLSSLGDTGGANTHTLALNEIPKHRHTLPRTASFGVLGFTVSTHNAAPSDNALQTDYSLNDAAGSAVGGGAAHNNQPKFLALNFLIKT